MIWLWFDISLLRAAHDTVPRSWRVAWTSARRMWCWIHSAVGEFLRETACELGVHHVCIFCWNYIIISIMFSCFLLYSFQIFSPQHVLLSGNKNGDSGEKAMTLGRTARCFCVKLRSTGLMQVPVLWVKRVTFNHGVWTTIWDCATNNWENHGKFKVVICSVGCGPIKKGIQPHNNGDSAGDV